jgi:hypothetical protein
VDHPPFLFPNRESFWNNSFKEAGIAPPPTSPPLIAWRVWTELFCFWAWLEGAKKAKTKKRKEGR